EDNVAMTAPYAPGVSNIYVDSILRALIVKPGDDETLRRQIIIAAVERGIDTYAARAGGIQWYAAGGTNFSFKLPTVFAALMLNNQTIKNTLNASGRNDFAESGSVWPSSRPGGPPVWGQDRGGESSYWDNVASGNPGGTTRDPYFIIDGGSI